MTDTFRENMTRRFVKKPIEVEAFRPGFDDMPEWFVSQPGFQLWTTPDKAVIKTLEGDMTISQGDYVIKGIKGEIYPCKPDIFESSYDEIFND